ncbi:MAG: inositol monophosphatase [Anaerolineaceae bacterium]|nr:inositol monophosphatase [Anaerolineaceae bacterium]
MKQPQLGDLIRIAKHAGKILKEGFGTDFQIDHKGLVDLVTDMDRRSEEYILNEIRTTFPGDEIVSEESGTSQGNHNARWIVDPLDGTVNYAHRLPIYSVSIAYAIGKEVQLGVVYNPAMDECFTAERGKGAWLNEKPIRAAGAEKLVEALLVTGFPYDIRTTQFNNMDQFNAMVMKSQGMRRLGSAALDCCYIADGRLDGYWEFGVKTWDVAAGGLIAEEAGVVVTDVNGGADYLKSPLSICMANSAVHKEMLEVLKGL